MLNYTKLWLLLEKKGMKKTDLTKNKVISTATLAKLGKNETISSDVIEKLCKFLNCQPGDIMEYISEDQIRATIEQIDVINKTIVNNLQEQGISEEQYLRMMTQIMPEMIKSLYNGGNPLTEMFDNETQNNDTKK